MSLFLTALETISRDTPLASRIQLLGKLFPTPEEKMEVFRSLYSSLETPTTLLPKRKVSVVICNYSYGFELGDMMPALQQIDPTSTTFTPFGYWTYDEKILDKVRYHPYLICAIRHKLKRFTPAYTYRYKFEVLDFDLSPLETLQIIVGHVYSDDGDERVIVRKKRLDELDHDPIPVYENLRPQEEVEKELAKLLP